ARQRGQGRTPVAGVSSARRGDDTEDDVNSVTGAARPQAANRTQPQADNRTQPQADNTTQPQADNRTQPQADNTAQPQGSDGTQPQGDARTQARRAELAANLAALEER